MTVSPEWMLFGKCIFLILNALKLFEITMKPWIQKNTEIPMVLFNAPCHRPQYSTSIVFLVCFEAFSNYNETMTSKNLEIPVVVQQKCSVTPTAVCRKQCFSRMFWSFFKLQWNYAVKKHWNPLGISTKMLRDTDRVFQTSVFVSPEIRRPMTIFCR